MISLELLILIILGVLILSLLAWIISLHVRLSKLSRGAQGTSLEKIFTNTLSRVETLDLQTQRLASDSARRDVEFMKSIQGVGFVRFNPFDEPGSQQSFACALIDQHGDGIVMSTLSTRDKMRFFGKKITQYVTEQELTKEEEKAISDARESLTQR